MEKFVKLTIILIALLFLSGCWDAKDLQELQYITALGVDIQDGQYIIYGQAMSFAGVAKQENNLTATTPVWVAKGYGKTVNTAMNDFYKKSNQAIYWGHVDVIVYSENVLKKGINKVNDSLLRFQQIRETTWVYGTNEPLEKVLLVSGLFGSASQTSLFNPNDMYKLYSYITPLRIQRFYVDYNEPGVTVKLPSLTLNKSVWKGKKEKQDTAKPNGVYLIKDKEMKGKLVNKEIEGLRWVTKETKRTPLAIKSENEKVVVISIMRPEVEIKPTFVEGDVRFELTIKAKGNVIEMEGAISLTTLKKEMGEGIRKEVMKTFNEGLNIGADVYNLEEVVYRKHLNQWKRMFKDKAYRLSSDSIKSIDVHVDIQHTGDFKFEHIQ